MNRSYTLYIQYTQEHAYVRDLFVIVKQLVHCENFCEKKVKISVVCAQSKLLKRRCELHPGSLRSEMSSSPSRSASIHANFTKYLNTLILLREFLLLIADCFKCVYQPCYERIHTYNTPVLKL